MRSRRIPFRNRQRVVTLTSLLDLLFVIVFAFMLQKQDEVEAIAEEKSVAIRDELAAQRDSALIELEQAREAHRQAHIEATQAKAAAAKTRSSLSLKVAELKHQIPLLQAQFDQAIRDRDEFRRKLEQAQIAGNIRQSPPVAGRWQLTGHDGQEPFSAVLTLSRGSATRQRVVYSGRFVWRATRPGDSAIEEFRGHYDAATGTLKLQGTKLLKVSGGWALGAYTAESSADGKRLLHGHWGARSRDNANTVVPGNWSAVWKGPK